ncbi:MAG: hypothetical protein ACRC8Q_04000, partial [Aeromonas sp.]
ANPQERFSSYETAIKSGVMCPNEAREKEGMSPRKGGDDFSQAWMQKIQVTGAGKEKADD